MTDARVICAALVLSLDSFALCVLSADEKDGADKRPPFDKLLELNGEKIFGGKTEVKKDRVVVHFAESRHFKAGFLGDSVQTPDDLKGPNRELLKKPKDGEVKNAVGVGIGDGRWSSKFSLHDDFKIDFKITFPRIFRNSQLSILVNQDRKSYLMTSFFGMATVVENGSTRKREITSEREFTTSPDRWYDKKGAEFPVSLQFSKGKLNVSYNEKNLLSLEGADNVSSGRIGLQFKNVSFIISELRIDAQLNREWCEEQLARLERVGDLVLEEPAPAAETKQRKKIQDAAERERRRKEEAEVDL